MRRCVDLLLALGIALTGTHAAAGLNASPLDPVLALRTAEAAVGRTVPDLVLTDRHGKPVRLSSLRGQPVLVSFIYTGCFQVCPTQTRALLEAVNGLDKLLGPSQFRVVSIGFNQPFDSPAAMRAFAAQQQIHHANWEFLSPTAAQVEPLTKAFGFSYASSAAGFDHLLGVSLVDAQGRIRSQIYGDRLRADQLGEPLRRLLLDAPLPARLSVGDLIEQVRILCTIYDPETGTYRYDYKLVFELVGGALFFVSVAIYFILEWRTRRRHRRDLTRCMTPSKPLGGSA